LQDARVDGLGGTLGHDTSRPYPLHFSAAAKSYEFMKLDEAGKRPRPAGTASSER